MHVLVLVVAPATCPMSSSYRGAVHASVKHSFASSDAVDCHTPLCSHEHATRSGAQAAHTLTHTHNLRRPRSHSHLRVPGGSRWLEVILATCGERATQVDADLSHTYIINPIDGRLGQGGSTTIYGARGGR